MKFYSLFIAGMIFLSACGEKIIDVYSLEELPGTWRWESTCGMFDTSYTCINASKTNYATIEFGKNGLYTEKRMDTIFHQTEYQLVIIDDMMGSLVLADPPENRPLTLINSRLIIQRNGFEDNFVKIK
ncbi:MAG: hypothetical protein JXR66_01120 [Bacteroidales bacterium]|nr:hypothetical protein [Bacteroidales bacterium]